MWFVAADMAVRVADAEGRCWRRLPLSAPLSRILWKGVYSSVASDAWEGDCNVGV